GPSLEGIELRNREAARYARWSAMAAGIIVLIVAGVYVKRKILEVQVRHGQPPAVPASVKQSSAEFAYSKVDKDRTIFTIRASHATEFKDQNRAVLEDVWITIYGQKGDRNDNIHTRECSFEPKTGAVRCEGDVEINLQSAQRAAGQPAGSGETPQTIPLRGTSGAVVIKTRDLTFNRQTGLASTSQPVDFTLPDGQGRGVGMSYSSDQAIVRLERDVQLDMQPSEQTGGLPVRATGSSLEIRRNDRVVTLAGPASVKQGERELTAEAIVIELDDQFHARRATAMGHPVLRSGEGGASLTTTAEKFEGFLSAEGWVERVVAEGNVAGTRTSAKGSDHFSAAQTEFAMLPKQNLIETMTATGGVKLESQDAAGTRRLTTEALRAKFSATGGARQGTGKSATLAAPGAAPGPAKTADQQRIESAETLGPATIETHAADDTTKLHAGKFVVQFGADGRFEKLMGHSGAEITRQSGKGAPQTSTAADLVATFDASGEWATLDESGNVHFQQGDRRATAAHAHIDRAADTMALEGSPVLMDAESRTTAAKVMIGQKSGEIHATGGVVSTYLPPAKDGSTSGSAASAINLGSGAAHISADALEGSTTSGHVKYTGRARVWQGESVLDADTVEIWRDEKKMQATGHVIAVFPQAAGQSIVPGDPQGITAKAGSKTSGASGGSPSANTVVKANGLLCPASQSGARSGPTLWQIRAPQMTYWDAEARAHLEGGVTATSQQGTLVSQTLDVFLAPAPTPKGNAGGSSSGAAPPTSRQLSRALALGSVVVSQGDRRGTADQAEYTASDEKFVLSGGKPTITDASSDTTTGRSLTFFVANDTILIDSQEGSRTLTKHRVEK
ncbi:MAG: LPS export ABC transporter periplasmic protein LptC, partial [Candidatus Acidiferrales bacterium]